MKPSLLHSVILVGVGVTMLSAPLAAQRPAPIVVKVGATALLNAYGYVPSRCEAQGTTRVVLVGTSRLGSAFARENTPFTVTRSNYPQCIGVSSVGTGLFYTAAAPGEERLRVAITYPDGYRETDEVQVRVEEDVGGRARP